MVTDGDDDDGGGMVPSSSLVFLSPNLSLTPISSPRLSRSRLGGWSWRQDRPTAGSPWRRRRPDPCAPGFPPAASRSWIRFRLRCDLIPSHPQGSICPLPTVLKIQSLCFSDPQLISSRGLCSYRTPPETEAEAESPPSTMPAGRGPAPLPLPHPRQGLDFISSSRTQACPQLHVCHTSWILPCSACLLVHGHRKQALNFLLAIAPFVRPWTSEGSMVRVDLTPCRVNTLYYYKIVSAPCDDFRHMYIWVDLNLKMLVPQALQFIHAESESLGIYVYNLMILIVGSSVFTLKNLTAFLSV